MKGRLLLAVVALSLVTGCSGSFRMPWEKSYDPSEIPTREPLEIPPDLYSLPKAGYDKTGRQQHKKSQEGSTANEILFGGGEAGRSDEMGRNEQETLPDWVGSKP
uniref:Lipoprotein n=1 Tax=Magnetococcus massalia (strain MO-1) TaxID=451514 RepID=A0A1S7LEY3_MAGMO|nr:conserved exported protein of unknown function [Candidatus Magnetococcus massalia]